MEPTTNGRHLELKWIGLAWFGVAFTSVVIATVGGIVRGNPTRLVRSWGVSDFSIFAITVYVVGVALAVAILWRLLRRRGLGAAAIGLRGRLTGSGAGLALLAVPIAWALYRAVEAGVGRFGVNMYWVPKATHLVLRNNLDLALTLVFAVVLGPILEEILFRGYLMTALLDRGRGVFRAAVLSGLVFTSTHVFIGAGTMVFILFWSFLPALLYWRFKSLYPGILFHVLNNFLAYVVVPVVFS